MFEDLLEDVEVRKGCWGRVEVELEGARDFAARGGANEEEGVGGRRWKFRSVRFPCVGENVLYKLTRSVGILRSYLFIWREDFIEREALFAGNSIESSIRKDERWVDIGKCFVKNDVHFVKGGLE